MKVFMRMGVLKEIFSKKKESWKKTEKVERKEGKNRRRIGRGRGGGRERRVEEGKEYVKTVYRHPAYLTSMQSTSCEMLDRMKHKLESRLPGEISITSDMQMTPP